MISIEKISNIFKLFFTVLFFCTLSFTVQAASYDILYESDTDTTTNELVLNSFDSFSDVINYNYSATIVDVDISAAYSSTGLTYDGDDWHILYESDADTTTNELVLNSFDTWADVIDYNYTSTIIDVDISAGYSSTGLAYENGKWHILYESDADTTTNELVINSFDDLDDLINYNYSATIVDVDISAGYSSTGFTYDDGDWHILYEADADTTTNELVINTFSSFGDIIDYNYASTIVDVDISAAYSSTGFNALPPPDVSVVPLPAGIWLLGTGLFGLYGLQRRREKIV
ncbi:hypothetical protein A9Q83_09720 [Alphaproteobacteria bacterium 46_93_T64]|nr:hypothetical protein A9Q83_09720 [Alphaproteobacteria bacterium 46_93_T64]